MNATTGCPFPIAWTPQQIAGVAPGPRILELEAAFAPFQSDFASSHSRPHILYAGYLGQTPLSSRFRVHG